MGILDFISSFGRKRLDSAKTVTGENNPCSALVYQLKDLTDMLPEGKMHLEVLDSQVAIVIAWDGKVAPCPLKPVSVDMAAGSKMVVLKNMPDGKPFYSVLQSDDAKSNTDNGEAPLTTNNSSLITNQQTLVRSVKAFLAKHFLLRFNLLTQQTECAKVEELDDNGHHIYYNVDTRMINSMTEDAIDEGINCWNQDISRSVNSSKVKTYHPFHDYFENLPEWDGVDRVTPLAQQLSNDPLIVKSFHRWMLAMTAQWMRFGDERYANSVAPLLISEKQGWGKSTFCRSLIPQELSRYYTDSYDLTAASAAEQKLTTFGLINLDEFDKLSSKKMATLKNLMQMPTTNIRRPYKQAYEHLPRIASFIGTSNRKDLLFDKTGSRRFICIELKSSLSPALPQGEGEAPSNSPRGGEPNSKSNQVPSPWGRDREGLRGAWHALLYSQLKAELLAGERYWFSKAEEAEIQEHNKKYYHTSPAEEIFSDTFRRPESNDEKVLELTAANIYERLRKRHPKAMQSISSTAFARLMPTLAAVEHTRYGNVYRVVEK